MRCYVSQVQRWNRWLLLVITGAACVIACLLFWPPTLNVPRMLPPFAPDQPRQSPQPAPESSPALDHSQLRHDGLKGKPTLPTAAHPRNATASNVPQTKANASNVPQTKANTSNVPQTKANASNVPQTKANTSNVPQTKANTSNVPQTKATASDDHQTKGEIIVTQKTMDYSGNVIREVPPKEGGRFLIFECVSESHSLCGGWADRQEGLVMVFLLAYLTKRRYGIRMNTPCEVTKFVIPNEYNWIVPEAQLKGKSTRVISAIDRTSFSAEMPTVDFNAKYKEDVVVLRTNRDLLSQIRANPHYRDVLPSWAKQARPEFFRDVWHTLMKPAADLQHRLEKFLQSLNYFSRTRPLVGVHMRTGGSKHFNDVIMKGRSNSTGALWDFIQPFVSNGSDVFVATDNPDVLKSSAARFGSRHHDAAAVLRHTDRQRSDPVLLSRVLLSRVLLSRVLLSRVLLSKVLLSRVLLSRVLLSRVLLSRLAD
ncbi:hypothetical protein ACOMHN_054744 [Nucella lapillus]